MAIPQRYAPTAGRATPVKKALPAQPTSALMNMAPPATGRKETVGADYTPPSYAGASTPVDPNAPQAPVDPSKPTTLAEAAAKNPGQSLAAQQHVNQGSAFAPSSTLTRANDKTFLPLVSEHDNPNSNIDRSAEAAALADKVNAANDRKYGAARADWANRAQAEKDALSAGRSYNQDLLESGKGINNPAVAKPGAGSAGAGSSIMGGLDQQYQDILASDAQGWQDQQAGLQAQMAGFRRSADAMNARMGGSIAGGYGNLAAQGLQQGMQTYNKAATEYGDRRRQLQLDWLGKQIDQRERNKDRENDLNVALVGEGEDPMPSADDTSPEANKIREDLAKENKAEKQRLVDKLADAYKYFPTPALKKQLEDARDDLASYG